MTHKFGIKLLHLLEEALEINRVMGTDLALEEGTE
jgi:hypothetical protein